MLNRNQLKRLIKTGVFSCSSYRVIRKNNGQILEYITDSWTSRYLSYIKNVSIESIFMSVCFHDHIDKATMIVEHFRIDIHNLNEYTFRLVCINGHLDTAKWLVELNKRQCREIDIHAHNEWFFRITCYNGHFEMTKWLTTLCPNKYSYNILENNIIDPIIKN